MIIPRTAPPNRVTFHLPQVRQALLPRLEGQLAELEQLAESGEYDKEKIIKSIDVLREIIRKQALTNTNIMMLIDKVVVRETEELGQYNRPKLDLEIVWNIPFVNG